MAEPKSSNWSLPSKFFPGQGGAVAEWSKALLLREKINEKPKDPRFAPAWATFYEYYPGPMLLKFS